MSPGGRPSAIFLAALVLATAGLCLSAYTVRQAGESARILALRQQTLRELASLREQAARTRSGLGLLETLTGAPADPAAAAQKVLPSAKVAFDAPRDQQLPGGWTLRQVVATLDGVPPGEAGRLVEHLENQVPPWRLMACDVTAAAGGLARTKLTLQTLLRAAAR